jgi:dienelactone hydrolase
MAYTPDPEAEPLRILLARGVFMDASRDGRKVPWKLYHPAEYDGPALPLIVWSHGLGGSRDNAGFLARHIASHGYNVLHIQHPGTDSSLWEGKPGHPWDVIRATPIPREMTLARFEDVPFALDSFEVWAQENPEIGQYIDFTRIGMSGHSFGAMTTQAAAGMLFPAKDGTLLSFRVPRFRAGILYSPVPIRHLTGAADSSVYDPIAIPLFHMTGTKDESPVEGFSHEARKIIFEYGTGPAALLELEDGDHMVYVGSRGQLGENPKRAEHEMILKVAALAWWDAFLKDDPAAREWLERGGFAAWLPEGMFEWRA